MTNKTGVNVKIDKDFFEYLKKRKIENKSNFRVESYKVFSEYKEIKQKLGKGRVFVIK